MTTTGGAWETADALREENRALDEELLALLRSVPPECLPHSPGDGEWNLAENLAHVAEFPRYFARQLADWLAGRRTVIGRVAEHSADRNDAIARAPGRGLAQLRDEAEASFDELATTLAGLRDEHLDAPTVNVKYGHEPLRRYLDRYVVGHKAAHLDQLRRTLAGVGAGGAKREAG